LRLLTDYSDYEVIVVDNGSGEHSTLEYLVAFERAGHGRVLRMPGPFNFSRLNNRAAQEAEGDVLLLLNDDVEVVRGDWLAEMVGHAMRPEVGAVGAKLLHPTGRVQHAGVVLGLDGVAGHVHRGLPADAPGHMGRALVVQNWSAVTGACMACRRSVYQEIGGMDETSLPVSYNDVDFCLRLGRHGYRIVWTPHAVLRHRESFSRRPDSRPENRARARAEYEAFLARWPSASQQDGAFSPNLARVADGTGFACPPRTRRPWRLPPQA
jgi:GT2 family glycosyltransferase